jgi:hypothetical protein
MHQLPPPLSKIDILLFSFPSWQAVNLSTRLLAPIRAFSYGKHRANVTALRPHPNHNYNASRDLTPQGSQPHDKMRLLNLNTLDLVEFMHCEKPPYVILSHTWDAEEVSLQELQSPRAHIKQKKGWTKIQNFAQKGEENGFEWGWVDTCCIDKTSSAELSEAINSMFKVSNTIIPICFFLYGS